MSNRNRFSPLPEMNWLGPGIDAKVKTMLSEVVNDAALEAGARGITLSLIREFGVTVPRLAMLDRKAKGDLLALEEMVLAKLEAISKIIGSP